MDTDYIPKTASSYMGEAEQDFCLPALSVLGDRMEGVAANLTGFVSRWRGGMPQEKDSAAPQPSGYAAQIRRIERLMSQIESLTGEINNIG